MPSQVGGIDGWVTMHRPEERLPTVAQKKVVHSRPVDILGDQDVVCVVNAEGAAIEHPVVEDAERQAVLHAIGPIFAMPFHVSGLQRKVMLP